MDSLYDVTFYGTADDGNTFRKPISRGHGSPAGAKESVRCEQKSSWMRYISSGRFEIREYDLRVVDGQTTPVYTDRIWVLDVNQQRWRNAPKPSSRRSA